MYNLYILLLKEGAIYLPPPLWLECNPNDGDPGPYEQQKHPNNRSSGVEEPGLLPDFKSSPHDVDF